MSNSAYNFQAKIYDNVIYFTYFLMIVSALGMSEYAPNYVSDLNNIVKIYVCLFLIWRFNPLRKQARFHDLDRRIAFSAGIFILTTTVLNEYLIQFKDEVKKMIYNL